MEKLMPTILAYGDSNTHGTRPIEYEGQRRRLGPQQRWPGIVRNTLGSDWSVIEEGLPGRTTRYPDPEMGPHMDGRVGLFIALESHGPIDVMTIMLGTNDLKQQFDLSASEITEGMEILINIALSEEMQDRHGGFDILVIAPPTPLERGILAEKFDGSTTKSAELPKAYAALAARYDVDFLDASSVVTSSDVDGVHFEADQHALLGAAISAKLNEMTVSTPS